MARKIAISNQKGGVGKTTTAINIADALKHSGYDVLFIDLDPQCNSTGTYKAKSKDEYTIYDVMAKNCDIKTAIQKTSFGDIVPGDIILSTKEMQFATQEGGYNLVKEALTQVEDEYDFVIMDTPPNLGIYMLNALTAADGCIIPIKAEIYAVEGLSIFIDTVNEVVANANSKLKVYGVLLTSYDRRLSLDNRIWNVLPKVGEDKNFPVFRKAIRICQDIRIAQERKESLFDIAPYSNAAKDYALIVKEILEK